MGRFVKSIHVNCSNKDKMGSARYALADFDGGTRHLPDASEPTYRKSVSRAGMLSVIEQEPD
jgi:hypothetical protein